MFKKISVSVQSIPEARPWSRYVVYDLTVTQMSRDIIMIATTSLIYYVRVVLKTIANQTDGNQLGCQYPCLPAVDSNTYFMA